MDGDVALTRTEKEQQSSNAGPITSVTVWRACCFLPEACAGIAVLGSRLNWQSPVCHLLC